MKLEVANKKGKFVMREGRKLGRAGAYWTAAAVALIALWTSGAPSTSYPLYSDLWQLNPVVITAIFGTYPLTLVLTLVTTGSLSDYVGRRVAILLGMLGMLLGTLLFAVAVDVEMLFVGRALMGVGVGLALSPASAAVLEFSKRGREPMAASVTTAATALGVVLSTLIGGALVQYGPLPLALDFWVLVAVIVAVGGFAFFLPEPSGARSEGRWRPEVNVRVPAGQRIIFTTAALAASVAYMTGGLLLALGASIARDLLMVQNALLVGCLLATMFLVAGGFAVVARRLTPRVSMRTGGLLTIAAFTLLVVAATLGSTVFFIGAAVAGGAAYATAFSGGLSYVSIHAPAHHRAGVISAFYLAAYASQGSIAVVLGLVATFSGLLLAVFVSAAVMIVLSAATVVLTFVRRHRRGAPSTSSLAAARIGTNR